jgi:hypothetical protein
MPKLLIPTNKDEARQLLMNTLDRLDGTPDEHFDGRLFAVSVYRNLVDDLKENAFIAAGAIFVWEVGKAIVGLFF